MRASATFRHPSGVSCSRRSAPRAATPRGACRSGTSDRAAPRGGFGRGRGSSTAPIRGSRRWWWGSSGGRRGACREGSRSSLRGPVPAARARVGPVRALGQGEGIGEVAEMQQAGRGEAPVAARIVDALELVRHAERDRRRACCSSDRRVRERFAELWRRLRALQRRGPRRRRASCRRTMRSTAGRCRGG